VSFPTSARCRGESTRWTDNKNVVYPDDPVVPAGEALRIRNQRRLRALGIARAKTVQSPMDRLIHGGKRTIKLFGFHYQLEMYSTSSAAAGRYFALPILYGDRLVGKLGATADRKAGVLRVNAIHQDETFDKAAAAADDNEIKDLAR